MRELIAILPEDARAYRGEDWVLKFCVFYSVVITGRSLVHLCRDDGGAHSIAGIDLDVEGGQNIVSIFAQWGLVQLLSACISWIVLIRYRGLIPLMLLNGLVENIGRIAVGRSKPLKVHRPPPGAYGQVIILPFLALALWQSLPKRGDP